MSARAAATLAGRSGTAAAPGVPALVRLEDLRLGEMLAEGGEGRVFQLPRQPHLLYKNYRRPMARPHLEELVAWPEGIDAPDLATRVRTASAWPCSVVADEAGEAVGLLMPRAPRRFSLRHRDGHRRLASLSYLTADPGHRAVAYGLDLPAAVSPERVALVYALARLLSAFETPVPSVAHGDLSTKNVLWSLQRGPEIFVIDCDNSDSFGPDGRPLRDDGRRRAMTPNWDDPAVPRGENPTPASDRYSLPLIFLRVVGAANFPVQARQRAADEVEVAFPVPPGPGADVLLDPNAAVWDLCGRGLSRRRPEDRPAASEWLGPLEALLAAMGAGDLVGQVWAAQDGGAPLAAASVVAAGAARAQAAVRTPAASRASHAGADRADRPGDVAVVPVRTARRPEKTWTKVSPNPRYGAAPEAPAARPIGYQWAPLPAPAARLPVASAQSGARSAAPTGALPVGATATAPATAPRGWVPNHPGATSAPNGPAVAPPAAPGRGSPAPGPSRPAGSAGPGLVTAPAPGAPRATASRPGATAVTPGGAGPTVPTHATAMAASAPSPAVAVLGAPVGDPLAGGDPIEATETAPGPGVEARAQLARFARWWRGIHAAMLRALLTPGRRRGGVRSLLFCVLVDFAVLVVVGAVVASIVSPIVQG